ncbi:CheR family methyltransferase [Quadrisphaera setariae]|uniref:protein-glutamate O-methyltransferase n=1 Tax=Quadrisphaera setariae TaxID=2593304 RepID=A0A5C8ZE31_9ACTN|nr:protein-glutamate O-methyltransferase CheR [Quadrisphaera setariae]TXR55050.1 protein-glutamate O-methyltransferase CheR [Quadrisphaera setariae]
MTLAAADFSFVSDLVRRESAIVLAPGKEYLVEARLLPLARKAGAAGVAELVEKARRHPDRATTQKIVEALTTNETSWYRDGDPFSQLGTTVFPQLLASRPAGEKLRVWSAASSSGQEPYTIAMVASETIPGGSSRLAITATDLSVEMVERTRAGRFSQLEVNRGLPAPMLVRHFSRAGAEWEVAPALRAMVTASQLNLAQPFPRMGPFDVVFLRNVLIYFDVPTKQDILRRIRAVMKPDGWLFLGAAETTLGVDTAWERVALGRTSAYRPIAG